MDPRVVRIYELAVRAHAEIYAEVARLREDVKKNNDMKDLANNVYALRESAKRLDDIEKETRSLMDTCEKIVKFLEKQVLFTKL